ncbi:MAG TPA: hypothetical protein ENI55_03960 [Alphaproteobacteria bacterium]|nr:hypothetical protein [Alphaproteobacteria bacterium]
MKRITKQTFFSALIVVLVFLSFSGNFRAWAQEVRKEEKTYAFPLQLFPFNVPFIRRNGRRGNTIVVLYLDLQTPEDVKKVCLVTPRIRDTLVGFFLSSPLKAAGGKINLDGIPERIRSAINKELGTKQVAGVKMTYGIGIRRMEGARSCKEFLKEFKKKPEKKKE